MLWKILWHLLTFAKINLWWVYYIQTKSYRHRWCWAVLLWSPAIVPKNKNNTQSRFKRPTSKAGTPHIIKRQTIHHFAWTFTQKKSFADQNRCVTLFRRNKKDWTPESNKPRGRKTPRPAQSDYTSKSRLETL